MPPDYRLGLNEDQGFAPPSPETMHPYPEQAVGEADLGPLDLPAQGDQLLPQREVLRARGRPSF